MKFSSHLGIKISYLFKILTDALYQSTFYLQCHFFSIKTNSFAERI